MAKFAVVVNGAVKNIIKADPGYSIQGAVLVDLAGVTPVPSIGWNYDGESFAPAVEIPEEISRYQALVALDRAGLLDSIETYMADAQRSSEARIGWLHAKSFRRSSRFINDLAADFGLTSTQVDDLFIAAAEIEDV